MYQSVLSVCMHNIERPSARDMGQTMYAIQAKSKTMLDVIHKHLGIASILVLFIAMPYMYQCTIAWYVEPLLTIWY